MAVEIDTSRVSYTGAGSTGPFTIPFYFISNEDIRAIRVLIADGSETELALTTGFTLTGAGDEDGGELTLVDTISSSYKLVIFRDPENLQEARFPRNDPFPAATNERVVDLRTMVAQRHAELIARSVRLPDGDTTGIDPSIPPATAADRANKVIGFDSAGTALELKGAVDNTLLAAQLADTSTPSNGSSLIGWLRAATGAVATTLKNLLGWGPINVFEFMTTAQIADVQSGALAEDVTVAIQAAITAAESGRSVFFPDGNYKASSNISVANKLGLRIYGERNSRITFTDGSYVGITLASTSSRILFENMELYGTSSSSTGLTLLAVDAPYCKIRENAFVNADTCISLAPSAVTYIGKIKDNDFATYDKAITMGTGSGTWNVDYDISGNTFGTAQTGSTQPAVEIQDGAGIRLRGNYFELQADGKLSVSVLSGRATIQGNDFVDSGGILSAGSSLIAGNNFSECATRDTVLIDITAGENVVTGNILNESGVIAASIGIRCSGSNNTLTPNFVDRLETGWHISGDDNTIGGGAYTCTTGIELASGGVRNHYGNLLFRNNTTNVVDTNTNSVNFRYGLVAISADEGNNSSTLTPRQNEITNIWNTTLTADRTVTLSTTGALPGDRFEIIRTAAATGDFKLNVGTGPLAVLAAGEWCEVTYDGSAWVLTKHFPVSGRRAVSADKGNAAATLTVGVSEITNLWNTAITADRAVTLNTGAARNGDRFRIIRGASATGAFNLNVGTGPLKALGTAGTWCDVEFNGSAWMLTGNGSL